MDTAILDEIGLTGAEIKVFLALLELGSARAGQVVERAGLQNAVVHRAFHSLGEKGLLTYTLIGKIKQYQAAAPQQLLQFLDGKRDRLSQALPDLEARHAMATVQPQARIFEGLRGVRELAMLMVDTKTNEYVSWGGAQASEDLLGSYFWEAQHRRRIEKGIPARLLFHASLAWKAKQLNTYPKTEVRLTSADFEELTETIVCGPRIAILLVVERPFGFLIEEEGAARSYAKFFEYLWNDGKQP